MARGYLTSRATRSAIGKKKKQPPAREHEPVASPVSELWTSWCRGAPQHSLIAMPGPLNRLAQTTLPINPALGAFIGPKQHAPVKMLRPQTRTATDHHRFHGLTRFVLSPHLQVFSAYSLFRRASVWLNGAVPNQLMPCAPLAVSSPPWGGDTIGEGCLCTTGSYSLF